MFIESVMPSSHLILCHSLLLLPSIFPNIRVFSNESALRIRWPKYWSFSISPSNEYSGPISFRMDWLDCLAVQGILKSLLPHHSSKASTLQCSAFFMVPLLSSCCSFSFAFGCGLSFFGGSSILLLMVVEQLVVILVFSQEDECMSFYSGICPYT